MSQETPLDRLARQLQKQGLEELKLYLQGLVEQNHNVWINCEAKDQAFQTLCLGIAKTYTKLIKDIDAILQRKG